MANLYEIIKQIEDISEMVDEDWVLLPEAEKKLDELELTQQEKFKWLWSLIKNMESTINEIKLEKQRLSEKQRILENKVLRIKLYLKFILEWMKTNKYKAWVFSFSLRKSQSVVVLDWTLLPDEFVKITVEPKKTELKEALKSWQVIEWVSMQENLSLVIK